MQHAAARHDWSRAETVASLISNGVLGLPCQKARRAAVASSAFAPAGGCNPATTDLIMASSWIWQWDQGTIGTLYGRLCRLSEDYCPYVHSRQFAAAKLLAAQAADR